MPATLLTEIDSPIVREVVSFVYNTLRTELDNFFDKHVGVFDVSNEEHKLEYTTIYQEYEALLEEHLREFSNTKGYESPQEFYQALAKACNKSERATKMVQMLLAATDYHKFVALMRLKAKDLERKWRSEAKASNSFELAGDSKEQDQVTAAVGRTMESMSVGKKIDAKGGDSEESEEDGGWVDDSRTNGDSEGECDSSAQAESKSSRK
jgi:hypothetical protein